MWLVHSAYGIILIELVILGLIVVVAAVRVSGKKGDADIEKVTNFLNTIDKETLIHINENEPTCSIDHDPPRTCTDDRCLLRCRQLHNQRKMLNHRLDKINRLIKPSSGDSDE